MNKRAFVRVGFASLLLIGCAATSASNRFVVIESDSYGCGAVEGLGCGLAIAPVLVAIDEIDGVAESSVSWDGRYFRLELLPGADPDRATAAASALLEGESCCIAAPQGKAAPAQPDEWFDAERTRALSRHEAGVLASGFVSEVAAEIDLAADSADRLLTLVREELEQAFERAHSAGGGVHRLLEQMPQVRSEFESRLDFMTAEQRAGVLAVLDRRLEQA